MQVTVLTCRHVTDYKTSESTSSLHTPFLKALKTQNFKEPPSCSLLEQPNIVHDLPAAGSIAVHDIHFYLVTAFFIVVTGTSRDLFEVFVNGDQYQCVGVSPQYP